MPFTKEQIRRAALELDASDREALAEELWRSISDAERDEVDAAWLAEAKARDESFLRGESKALALEEVLQR